MPPQVRGEGKPYKDARTGLWVVSVELPRHPGTGKRQRRVIRRKSRTELLQARRELIRQLEDGTIDTSRAGKTTVAAWCQRWLDDIAIHRLRPRVLQVYAGTVRKSIIPYIGSVRLVDLAPQHIRDMHTEVLASGRSARTAQAAHVVFRKILVDAKREGLIRGDLVTDLVDKPKPQPKTRGALSAGDARKVLATAFDRSDPYATRWAMALLTGARQSECIGLTWDRVDLDAGTFDVSWTLQRVPLRDGAEMIGDTYPPEAFKAPADFEIRPLVNSTCLVRPKTTASIRLVPIPAPLLIALRRYRDTWTPNRWELLWVSDRGMPLHPKRDRANWMDALDAAGVERVVLHAARHTTATLLQAAGVQESVRMAIMGHSSEAAQRGYAHTDTTMAREAFSKIEDVLVIDPADVEVIDDVREGDAVDQVLALIELLDDTDRRRVQARIGQVLAIEQSS